MRVAIVVGAVTVVAGGYLLVEAFRRPEFGGGPTASKAATALSAATGVALGAAAAALAALSVRDSAWPDEDTVEAD